MELCALEAKDIFKKYSVFIGKNGIYQKKKKPNNVNTYKMYFFLI